eukprot:1466894-Rhodomonas_salina.1
MSVPAIAEHMQKGSADLDVGTCHGPSPSGTQLLVPLAVPPQQQRPVPAGRGRHRERRMPRS